MRTELLRALWWVPNALTITRGFIIGPAILYIYAAEYFHRAAYDWIFAPDLAPRFWAFALVILGIITEWLDGKLARAFQHYGWESKFGRDLDPAADKSFAFCVLGAVLLCGGLDWYLLYLIPPTLWVIVYSFRTSRMRWRGEIKFPNWEAKVKTAVLMGAKVVAIGGFFLEELLLDPFIMRQTIDIRGWPLYAAAALVGVTAILCEAAMTKYLQTSRTMQPAE